MVMIIVRSSHHDHHQAVHANSGVYSLVCSHAHSVRGQHGARLSSWWRWLNDERGARKLAWPYLARLMIARLSSLSFVGSFAGWLVGSGAYVVS